MDYEIVATGWHYYNWSVVGAVKQSQNFVTIVLSEATLRGSFSSVDFSSKEGYRQPQLVVH
jgi:hypothetical protein